MKASHGSRDGLASRARRPDGEDSDDGDDGERDERDEGPELRAMRSVWFTMRDEDPPEGGLAELLAAARAKAETMQARPTLWQRLAAGLRRPPALALATVLVLVGGAVLLGRRGMDAPVLDHARAPSGMMEADPTASATPPVGSPRADGSFAQGQTVANPAPADERAATRGGSSGDTATPEPAAEVEAAVKQTMTPDPARSRPAAVATAGGHRAADAEPVATAGERPGGFTDDTVVPPAPPPPAHVAPRPEPTLPAPSREVSASAPAPEGASSSGDLAGTARSSRNAPPPADTNDVARQAGKKASNEAKDDEATSLPRDKAAAAPGASPGASISQLYNQCESAAKRGDCAAVRRMVERIARSDRGYRARVAKDSPVGKCLAE